MGTVWSSEISGHGGVNGGEKKSIFFSQFSEKRLLDANGWGQRLFLPSWSSSTTYTHTRRSALGPAQCKYLTRTRVHTKAGPVGSKYIAHRTVSRMKKKKNTIIISFQMDRDFVLPIG